MLAEQDFRYIQDLVRERAAIVLEPGKEYLAVTRLDPLVRRAGLGSLSELVAAIDTERRHGNLSSAIRLFVLGHYRGQTHHEDEGEPRSTGALMVARPA